MLKVQNYQLQKHLDELIESRGTGRTNSRALDQAIVPFSVRTESLSGPKEAFSYFMP